MTGLDTNVLVRYLTQDDPAQARRANQVVADSVQRDGRCFIGPVVLCELAWVLSGAYALAKADLINTLDLILATRQFEVGDKDIVRAALEGFRAGRADFADYVIGKANHRAGCAQTVTFDRRLKNSAEFRVL